MRLTYALGERQLFMYRVVCMWVVRDVSVIRVSVIVCRDVYKERLLLFPLLFNSKHLY